MRCCLIIFDIVNYMYIKRLENMFLLRRDVPFGVPLDLSTPTGMSCIGTYSENCKSDNVSKYCVLLVACFSTMMT